MEAFNTVVRFFQAGGLFMYPIVVVFAIGLAIAIERYIYLSVARTSNRRMWDTLMPMISSGKYQQALGVTTKSRAAIAKILSYGLGRAKSARRRADVETVMEEGLMEIVPRLEKRTHYLATFANIATLRALAVRRRPTGASPMEICGKSSACTISPPLSSCATRTTSITCTISS